VKRHCHILTLPVVVLAMMIGLCDQLPAQSAPSASPVIVQLQAETRMSYSAIPAGTQVKLGDIATITDQNADRAAALKALDLTAYDPERTLTIDRSFVEIRIQLSGLYPDGLVVKGPEQVTIAPPPQVELSDLGVEQVVFESLCRQFSILPEDLRVKLVSPFIGPSLAGIEDLQQARLELMPPIQLPLGRSQLTIRILDGHRVVAAKPVTFEIARRQTVVVATASLDRAHTVEEQHVREETRFVDGPIDRLTTSQVVGRKVVLPFRPDEVVTLRHLGSVTEAESPVLVQPRDAVRLIAKKRGLTVTIPVAEALQQGRQGQLIRVRNVQSNQVVTGVVVARGEVHVMLP